MTQEQREEIVARFVAGDDDPPKSWPRGYISPMAYRDAVIRDALIRLRKIEAKAREIAYPKSRCVLVSAEAIEVAREILAAGEAE